MVVLIDMTEGITVEQISPSMASPANWRSGSIAGYLNEVCSIALNENKLLCIVSLVNVSGA